MTNRFVRGMFEAAKRKHSGRPQQRRGAQTAAGQSRKEAGKGGADRREGEEAGRIEDTAEFREAMSRVHGELQKLREDRARLNALRAEVERERGRLERDRESWERRKAEEDAGAKGRLEEEYRKLQRDRRVLEKQTKALLNLPGKKERQEIEEREKEIRGLKEEMQAQAAKVRTADVYTGTSRGGVQGRGVRCVQPHGILTEPFRAPERLHRPAICIFI